MAGKSFKVTPWEVTGKVNYESLIKEYGTHQLSDKLYAKLVKHLGKDHFFLRRKIFFSHRDLDKWIDAFEQGGNIALYTGRGPSGGTHLGHLMPWLFTLELQKAFKCNLYFELTDDEKFLYQQGLSLEDTKKFSYENALDVIAVGFDKKRTKIFLDTEFIKTMYPIALRVAKRITASIAQAVFGFKPETNIGMYFFPAMQAVPCFLPTELEGKPTAVLIPAAIDQDPYWRGVARYVAPKLGYPKPMQIHCMFLPGLGEEGKMSASDPNSAIFTTDDQKTVKKKVGNAFTGGKPTVEEQRKLGANPDICSVFKYYYYLFAPEDADLNNIEKTCRSGERLCGECKQELACRVNAFLEKHQAARKKAEKELDNFLVRD